MNTTQTAVAPEVLADTLAPLAARCITLTEQRSKIDAELEEIKAAIRDLVPGAGNVDLPDGNKVTIAPNTRFDEARALPLIPEALMPIVTFPETRVNKTLLKELAPDLFAQAQVTYAPRVSVK